MGKLGGDIIRARVASAPVPIGLGGQVEVAAGVVAVDGRAEGEPLHVVPVEVGEEEAAVEGGVRRGWSVRRLDAGAGVEHQARAARPSWARATHEVLPP